MTVDLTRGGNHLLHFVCFKVLINPGVSTFPLEKTIIGIFLIYKLLFIFFKLDLGGGGVREITNKNIRKITSQFNDKKDLLIFWRGLTLNGEKSQPDNGVKLAWNLLKTRGGER